MSIQWSSSGSFLLPADNQSVLLYSESTSDREPIPQHVYSHDFSADKTDQKFIESQVKSDFPDFRPNFIPMDSLMN